MSCMMCTSDNQAEFTAEINDPLLRPQEHQQSGCLIVVEGVRLLGLRFFRIYPSRSRAAETKGRERTIYERCIATSVFGAVARQIRS